MAFVETSYTKELKITLEDMQNKKITCRPSLKLLSQITKKITCKLFENVNWEKVHSNKCL